MNLSLADLYFDPEDMSTIMQTTVTEVLWPLESLNLKWKSVLFYFGGICLFFTCTARVVHVQALLTDQIRCHEYPYWAAWFSKKNLLNYLDKRKNGILYKNKHFKKL